MTRSVRPAYLRYIMIMTMVAASCLLMWVSTGGALRAAETKLVALRYTEVKVSGLTLRLFNGCDRYAWPYRFEASRPDGRRVTGVACVTPLWTYIGTEW